MVLPLVSAPAGCGPEASAGSCAEPRGGGAGGGGGRPGAAVARAAGHGLRGVAARGARIEARGEFRSLVDRGFEGFWGRNSGFLV